MTIQTIEANAEDLPAAAAAIPKDVPVFMLNLLRYKERADYVDERTDLTPCSGREAYYQRYVPAFNKVAAGDEIKITWLGNALARVVGPSDEQWDDVVIVEYPNFAVFRRIVESPDYKADAAPHRLAALENWRLIAMTKAELPG